MDSIQINMCEISPVEGEGQKRMLLVNQQGRHFYIGELVAYIINLLKENKSLEDIIEALNKVTHGTYIFDEAQVNGIIETKIRPLGIIKGSDEEPGSVNTTTLPNTIYGRFTLSSFKRTTLFLELFKYLFHPVFFFPALAFMIGWNLYYYSHAMEMTAKYTTVTQIFHQGDCTRDIYYVLIFYPIVFCTLLIHEMGHAASSYLFGVKPKSIGMGFYLIFPVMYCDVTGIYKLSRMKRTIVNLGGIFLQLIINSILFFLVFQMIDPDWIKALRYVLILNTFTIFMNLIPFFKFDGYWIFSDLANLVNVQRTSAGLTLFWLKKVFPFLPINIDKRVNDVPLSLKIYTVLKMAFYAYVYVILFSFIGTLYRNGIETYHLLSAGDYSICTIEKGLQTGLTFGLFLYIGNKYRRRIAPYVRASIKKRLSNG